MDNDGHIGTSVENIKNWAEYYQEIQDKLKQEQELNWHDKLTIQLLLHNLAHKMLDNPESYLKKKPRGRPNQSTKNKVQRHILILLATNIATSLKEAREKTAEHFHMSVEAVDKASRNIDTSKYLKT